MGDHIIHIRQPLLTTQGEESEIDVPVEDLGAAVNTVKDNDSETDDNENVKKPEEEEEEEEAAEKVECRFCHQEDLVNLLEAPCYCNGTLKYAHRVCVQRWCDAKGNITCEICYQPYQPNYTAVAHPTARGLTLFGDVNPPHLAGGRSMYVSRFTESLNEDTTTLGNLIFGTGVVLFISSVVVIGDVYFYSLPMDDSIPYISLCVVMMILGMVYMLSLIMEFACLPRPQH